MLTSDTEDTLTRLTGMVVGGTKAAARLQTQQQTTSLSASGTERQASGQAALKMDARTAMHSPQGTAQASKEKAMCSSSGMSRQHHNSFRAVKWLLWDGGGSVREGKGNRDHG
uniref:Uncharacterized protein n=1 Tax=Chrysotila carterae TaxID=13221 RepID=A0A6S9TBQ1_CHRCT